MLSVNIQRNKGAVKATQFKANLHINSVRRELGPMIVDALNTALDEKLKDDGSGWVQIYKDYLTWVESKGRWSLMSEEAINVSSIPLDRSMFWFTAERRPGNFLAKLNPWPHDLIPKLLGGYTGRIVVKPVSPAEIESARSRVEPELADLRRMLFAEGVTINADGLSLQGTVFIDMEFLAKRIEHGLGGFPRQPHLDTLAKGVREVLKR